MGERAALAGVSTTLPRRRVKVLTVRLVVGDPGHDDVAVLGVGLLAHDHVVAVEDAGLDHRLAPHPQHEQRARAR